jgi:hypothetical protein
VQCNTAIAPSTAAARCDCQGCSTARFCQACVLAAGPPRRHRPQDPSPSPKSKTVCSPPSAPLSHHELALRRNLQLRQETGADTAPALLQLVSLYSLWSVGENGDQVALVKGSEALGQLLERHRRGPPVDHALETAARWQHARKESRALLLIMEQLLAERRAALGARVRHPGVTRTLYQLGRQLKVIVVRFGQQHFLMRRAPLAGNGTAREGDSVPGSSAEGHLTRLARPRTAAGRTGHLL